jgi:Fe(3+) dicitrate transport protein
LRPNIGMRGASSDRSSKVTLLEDGLPLNPAPYAAPAAYTFPLTTRLVGVEVFKGPAATRFGPQTIGGAVNFLTRGVPDRAAGAMDLAMGSWDGLKIHGWAGVGGARGGVVAEVAHLSSGGFKHLPDGAPTGFSRQDVMLKGEVRTDPAASARHTVQLKLGLGREVSNETYLGLTDADFAADPTRRYPVSADDRMRWLHTQESLTWTFAQGDRVEVRTAVYHRWLHRVWDRLDGFAGGLDFGTVLANAGSGQGALYTAILRGEADSRSPDQQIVRTDNDRTFHAAGAQSIATFRAGRGPVRSQTEVGVRLHVDDAQRLHTATTFDAVGGALVDAGLPPEVTLDAHTGAIAVSAHVHEDLLVGPVRLLPGFRAEVVRTTSRLDGVDASPVTRAVALPGLAVMGEPVPGLSVFGGVHRGTSPVAPGSSPATPPETAWNTEAGLRWGHPRTRAELVGFYSHYEHITGACTFSSGCTQADLDQQIDGGRAQVYGVEASAGHDVPLPRGLSLTLDGSYTWTGARFLSAFESSFALWGDIEAGDRLPYVPEHQGAARLVLRHPRGSVTLATNVVGAMRDVASQGPIGDAAHIPTAALLDLAADVALAGPIRAYLTVSNLTGYAGVASLRPWGARGYAPTQVMVGVKVGG